MKNIYKILSLGLLIVLGACKDDTPDGVVTYDGEASGLFLDELSGVNLFYDAAVKAGLEGRFDGSDEYTYFVPNNDAMKVALLNGGYNSVDQATVGFCDSLVQNHTVPGKSLASDLSKGSLTTTSNQTIYVSIGENVILNAKSTVVGADNEASNAVIHVISYPILDFPSTTIADIVADLAGQDSLFTILNAALVNSGLDATLGGSDLYTVFAPTDDAFSAIGIADAGSLPTGDDLDSILLRHVFADRNFSMDLTSGRLYSALGDSSEAKGFDVSAAPDAVSIEILDPTTPLLAESTVTLANILATNGTIHIVDAVIFPEPYTIEALDGSADLGEFGGGDGVLYDDYLAAIEASADFNYDSLLKSEARYSLLVPYNYAGGSTREELLGYIFKGDIILDDVAGGAAIEAMNGNRYYVSTTDVGYLFNSSNTTTDLCGGESCVDDVEVYNGYISSINGSLTPLPEVSTETTMGNLSSDYDLYIAALAFLEIDSLIDHTYFYVDNDVLEPVYLDAIDAADNDIDISGIPADDYDSLVSLLDQLDASILGEVMNRHVFADVVFSAELSFGDMLTNLNGEELEYNSFDGGTTVGFVYTDDDNIYQVTPIDVVDYLGSNGVAHILTEAIPDPE